LLLGQKVLRLRIHPLHRLSEALTLEVAPWRKTRSWTTTVPRVMKITVRVSPLKVLLSTCLINPKIRKTIGRTITSLKSTIKIFRGGVQNLIGLLLSSKSMIVITSSSKKSTRKVIMHS